MDFQAVLCVPNRVMILRIVVRIAVVIKGRTSTKLLEEQVSSVPWLAVHYERFFKELSAQEMPCVVQLVLEAIGRFKSVVGLEPSLGAAERNVPPVWTNVSKEER